jgi:hypothetical protein
MNPDIRLTPGARIRLNEKARQWTFGLIFTVEDVRGWGVICYAQPDAQPENTVALKDSDRVQYRAAWDEIEAVEPPEAALV